MPDWTQRSMISEEGVVQMKEQYITITGINHYYGVMPFRIGMKVKCIKEPKNPYDSEAIRCEVKHLGKVGYVANSTYTVITGTKSAGRIRHKVKKKFKAEVLFISRHGVICKVTEGIKDNGIMGNIIQDNGEISSTQKETGI